FVAQSGEFGAPSAGATGRSLGASVVLNGGANSAHNISGAKVTRGAEQIMAQPVVKWLSLAELRPLVMVETSSLMGQGNSAPNGNILLCASRGNVGIGTTTTNREHMLPNIGMPVEENTHHCFYSNPDTDLAVVPISIEQSFFTADI
ncbi:MAG: hypothetical protein J0L82_19655, partial [Deltaproteobacteria bacterium]|nr:hypothetical protein [Deltaproteobacteria bacterium]